MKPEDINSALMGAGMSAWGVGSSFYLAKAGMEATRLPKKALRTLKSHQFRLRPALNEGLPKLIGNRSLILGASIISVGYLAIGLQVMLEAYRKQTNPSPFKDGLAEAGWFTTYYVMIVNKVSFFTGVAALAATKAKNKNMKLAYWAVTAIGSVASLYLNVVGANGFYKTYLQSKGTHNNNPTDQAIIK
jgi:hypothetical protein